MDIARGGDGSTGVVDKGHMTKTAPPPHRHRSLFGQTTTIGARVKIFPERGKPVVAAPDQRMAAPEQRDKPVAAPEHRGKRVAASEKRGDEVEKKGKLNDFNNKKSNNDDLIVSEKFTSDDIIADTKNKVLDSNAIRIEVRGPDSDEQHDDDDDVFETKDVIHENNKEHLELFSKFPDLSKQSDLFFKFQQTIQQDISEKLEALTEYKTIDATAIKRRDRSYATVQRLMLRTYLRRIQRFNLAVNRSLANLQSKINEDNISNLVDQHTALLNKLKTTLKHILDVSERYAAIDLFNELCHAVASDENSQKESRTLSRQCKSLETLSSSEVDPNKFISTSSLPNPGPAIILSDERTDTVSPAVTPADSRDHAGASSPPPPRRIGLQRSALRLLFPSSTSPTPSSPSPSSSPSSSPDSMSSLGVAGEEAGSGSGGRKRASSIQSITSHLAVLRKTYSANR